jgi:Fur family transcriptional regulator, ferric uptake regulator
MGETGSHGARDGELAAAIKQRIRSAGLRGTPARVATLLALQNSPSPLTHAEVAEQVEAFGADKATVLRNLADLVAAGLIRRSELGDHLYRYEVLDPAHPERAHPHFLCVDCGSVTCLDEVDLTSGSRRRSERVGKITEVLLKGHCTDCQV